MPTLTGTTTYWPTDEQRGGETFVWFWLDGGKTQCLTREPLSDYAVGLLPGTRVRVVGEWRERKTAAFRREDRPEFLLVSEIEVLEVPVYPETWEPFRRG